MEDSFVPTKCSQLKNAGSNNFQVVTFESHKPKRKAQKSQDEHHENKKEEAELNMKQVKHEIVKFGMSGFDPKKKQEAKIQLALKLGAKPEKNKYKNYKVLQKERLKERQQSALEMQFQQLGKDKLGKSIAKGKSYDRKRRKEKDGLLSHYGKVSKKEIGASG